MDKMQAYFSYIKATFQPELQPEAKIILGQYYRLQRRSDGKNAGVLLTKIESINSNFVLARTTIRLLESLIRVAQGTEFFLIIFVSYYSLGSAHARLMFRHTVEAQDAVVAVVLMEASITNSPLFEFKNPLHSMFPENPDEECITKLCFNHREYFDAYRYEDGANCNTNASVGG